MRKTTKTKREKEVGIKQMAEVKKKNMKQKELRENKETTKTKRRRIRRSK